jgi:hypothetical protein
MLRNKALTEKLLLLGVDGMDPRFTRRLVDEGKLPNVKKLMELGSCREDLMMLGANPTITPPMWATLATGTYPMTHGIMDYNISADEDKDITLGAFSSRFMKAEPLFNVTAKAGERVDVKVMLSGVPDGWSFCGIHFSYPDVLKPTISERTGNVECVRGDAVADMTDFLAVNWVDNKPPELIEKNLNSIFFCTMASGDYGTDGHITTFEFEIPADAQSGTVYDLEFFFREGDMFTNMAQDTVMQDQAFTNWKHGSITVE